MAYIAFFKNAMSCLNYILRGSEDHNIPPRIIFEIEAFRCTAAAPENICAKYEFFKPKTCIHDPFACTANSNWHRGSSCAQNSAIQQNKKNINQTIAFFELVGKRLTTTLQQCETLLADWYDIERKASKLWFLNNRYQSPVYLYYIYLLKKKSMKVLYQSLKSQTEMFNFKT